MGWRMDSGLGYLLQHELGDGVCREGSCLAVWGRDCGLALWAAGLLLWMTGDWRNGQDWVGANSGGARTEKSVCAEY